jgi:hypothetical protein
MHCKTSIAHDDTVLLLIVHFVLLCNLFVLQIIWGMAWPYQCRCCHHYCTIVVRLTRSRGVAALSSSSKHPVSRSIVASQPARTSTVANVHGYVTISRANKCREPLQTTPIASPSYTTLLGSRLAMPLSIVPMVKCCPTMDCHWVRRSDRAVRQSRAINPASAGA